MKQLPLACALVAGCGTFEDPTIVLDLRVLAMTTSLPEQVVTVDFERPDPAEILAQLQPTEVRALIADPAQRRPLRWEMTMCLLDEEGRCDRARPHVELGAGVIEDPDDTGIEQTPLVLIEPAAHGSVLLEMIRQALEDNPVDALGGVDYSVVLAVGPVEDRAQDVYAAKHLRIAPRIPTSRTANHNPRVDFVDSALLSGAEISLPQQQRCAALVANHLLIPEVRRGARVTLFPVESEGVREQYVVPTLDGKIAALEETLTYQWLATRGGWSDEFTGGGHDLLGNQSLLGSDWIAPSDVAQPTLVSLWMIQRDERYGAMWFETCIRVVP